MAKTVNLSGDHAKGHLQQYLGPREILCTSKQEQISKQAMRSFDRGNEDCRQHAANEDRLKKDNLKWTSILRGPERSCKFLRIEALGKLNVGTYLFKVPGMKAT